MSPVNMKIIIGSSAIALGLFSASVLLDYTKISRKISSTETPNAAPVQKHMMAKTIKPLGKSGSTFLVRVSPVSQLPDSADNELTLKAEVHLERPVDGEVRFKWRLPDDVALVEGDLEDSWVDLKPGQVAVTQITVYGVAKNQSNVIHFEVDSTDNGINVGSSALFSTRPEDLTISFQQEVDSKSNSNGNLKIKSQQVRPKLPKGLHL